MKSTKQIDLKGEINNLEITVGNFKTPVSVNGEKHLDEKSLRVLKTWKALSTKWS